MNFARLQSIKLGYADLRYFLSLLKKELSVNALISIERVDSLTSTYQNFMQAYNDWRRDQDYHSYADLVEMYREVLFEVEDKLFELRLKTGYAF